MYKHQLFLLDLSPVCRALPSSSRRDTNLKNNEPLLPSYDPYIPRKDSIFYNCSSLICTPFQFESLTQVTNPDLYLKSCFIERKEEYLCETIRYNHLKNIDKLLFLSNNIKNKIFYMVDCLVYEDSGRVCHKKGDNNSHALLVKSGDIVRPKEENVLSQDEFICEETIEGYVNCDTNPYISFNNTLKLKDAVNTDKNVLLKSGSFIIPLLKKCIDSWCGYSGKIPKSTRRVYNYEPPGGKVYRCYYAKKQQICKEAPELRHHLMQYNWLES